MHFTGHLNLKTNFHGIMAVLILGNKQNKKKLIEY